MTEEKLSRKWPWLVAGSLGCGLLALADTELGRHAYITFSTDLANTSGILLPSYYNMTEHLAYLGKTGTILLGALSGLAYLIEEK